MLTSATSTGPDSTTSSHPVKRPQRRNGFYRAVTIVTTFAMLFGGLLLMPMSAVALSATTTDRVNLRTGPGLEFDVIGLMPEGASLTVDGAVENGYVPVTYAGISGYASAAFISVDGSTSIDGQDGADGQNGADGQDGSDAIAGDGFPVTGGAPTGSAWVTADRLNFRDGPSLGGDVVSVLSEGDAVELTGQQSNGYWQAVVNGATGWLAADFLTTAGAPSDPTPDPDSGGSPVDVGDTVTGSATVNASLNLRSGPGLGYPVVVVMPSASSVELRGAAQNGYYPLSFDGALGWASGDFLNLGGADPDPTPDPGADDGTVDVGDTATGAARTTASLNLRGGPGLGFPVVALMPSGTFVELRGDAQNGFYPLSFNGTLGWASADYLTVGGDAPDPDPTPTPDADDEDNQTPNPGPGTGSGPDGRVVPVGATETGTARVTVSLNLRAGPGIDYDVRRVMPNGAFVELRGQPRGGFYPLAYAGTTGWASGDFLEIGASGSDPDPTPGPGIGDADVPQYLYTVVSVNMRSGPTTDDSVVWRLPPLTRITITGAPQNGFYPATWAHVAGWVSETALSATYQGPSTEGKEEIVAIIYAAADFYGQPREDMLRVAQCESGLRPGVTNVDFPNDPNSARGLFQFRPSTWATTPYADQDIFDAEANAYAAAWMWSVGRRNEWACQ
jgi:uncharacterized protein YraI